MYIGNDLQIAHPSYKIIDDISSGFNGSTTSFALNVSGATPVPFPISTQQVMISVNGVVQEPDPSGSAGFKLLGSNIVFSSAPANGHAFFGVINAGADYVTAGSEFPDGSATAPSFTFQDDQDRGWYRNASGDVGYSSNGSAILNFDGNGLTIAAGKGLTVDTNTLKVDATNNRVGIGTTSPQRKLVLYENSSAQTQVQFQNSTTGAAAGDGFGIGLDGDEKGFLWNYEGTDIYIGGSGGTALTLDGSQNATFAKGISLSATTQNTHLGLLASSTAINFSLGSTSGTSPRMYLYGTGNGQSSAGDIFVGAGTGGILHFRSAESIKFEVNSDNTTVEALSIAADKSTTFAGSITAGFGTFFQSTGQSTVTIGSGNAGGAALVLDGDSNGDASGADYSYIKHLDSGHLEIVVDNPNSNGDIYLKSNGGSYYAVLCRDNGVVELRYQNTARLETSNAGVTVTGTVSDSLGNLRSIPENARGTTYTLVATDAGKCVTQTHSSGFTINNSVFSAGDAVTMINNSGSDQTITQGSGVTLYNSADASTGNRTLASRGMATVWFQSASVGYISGAGLS